MASDISQRVLSLYRSFSKSQKKIAKYVLHDYSKIAYLTASRLAKTVGVSESTIFRFANLLGYDGYSDFQNALQELIKSNLTPNERIQITNRRIGRKDVIENVMESDILKIKHTLDNLDRDMFYGAVETILNSKNIYIMGARSSAPIAQLLSYNLSLIFDNIKHVQASSSQEVFEELFSISNDDVLVAFSFPRYSTKMVKAVQYAKSKGTKIIVVTDSLISPIADYATYLLSAESDMASFMDSLVAPVSIINAIVVEITRQREGQIVARFDKLEELWSEYDVYAKR